GGRRRDPSAARPERQPLYTRDDAFNAVEQCVPVEYDRPVAVKADVQLRFIDAGHLLGSAIVELTLLHGAREHRVVFTGDLGRRGVPFLRDPRPVPAGDLLISESTYGGRTHDTLAGMAGKMSDI